MKREIHIGGVVLIVIGVTLFLENFISIPNIDIDWEYVWPILLIALGMKLLFKKKRGSDKED